MTVAVTGGTGFVGQALLDACGQAGIPVRALARGAQAAREGVEWVRGDLGDADALARLVDGARAVLHVAGLTSAIDPNDFEAANVTGTQNVIDAMRGAGSARLVFVSSLSAREPALSRYGASKARAEEHVAQSGLDWTMVRPPAIYGPRDKDMFELFRSAKWGVVPVPQHGAASMIHVDDLARLLIALIPGGAHVSHRTFEPDDGRRGGWPHAEMAEAVGHAVGRRVQVIGLSRATMMRAARLDHFFRRNRAKLTLDRVGYMSHPDWVVSHGARPPHDLWHPRIDTREGLRQTAQWYREAGWL